MTSSSDRLVSFLETTGVENSVAIYSLQREGYTSLEKLVSVPPMARDLDKVGFNAFEKNVILKTLAAGVDVNKFPHPVAVIGTCDTKYHELLYIKRLIVETGVPAVLVDVRLGLGESSDTEGINYSAPDVLSVLPDRESGAVFKKGIERSKRAELMTHALTRWLSQKSEHLSGVIGIGGSSGTALIAPAFRSLPIGFPKLIVSTTASGNIAPFIGCSDITMMYSVTDIAGLNRASRKILGNAAHCISGMASRQIKEEESGKSAVGLTMFGVTTPCVVRITANLSDKYEPIVFHATGTGGQSMEKMVDGGLIGGVIDVTTTEVADFFMGGVFPCTEDRFGCIARTRAPCVVSCGALDMVNFGEVQSVPEKYRGRLFHEHNAQVTLMRTTEEENRKIGEWIAERLNKCEGPIRLVIPEKGVSMLDKEGGPFWDPKADATLFKALQDNLVQTDNRKLISSPYHINDPQFAEVVLKQWREITTEGLASKQEPTAKTTAPDTATTNLVLQTLEPVTPVKSIEPLPVLSTGFSHDLLMQRFKHMVREKIPIIGGGAGVGLSAKCEEAGGIDLIVIYNSGRYRMAGRGSLAGLLAYGNANQIVMEMAREVLPIVKRTPVLAGVNGTDPFLNMNHFLKQLKEVGFSGVQNFPTVGLIDGNFRANLEETGMGYALEVKMIAEAHKEGLLTTPYVFSEEDAADMAAAGADIIVCHLGLTVGGGIGAQTARALEAAPPLIDSWAQAALRVNPDIIVLCHGGPIANPEDAQFIIENCKHCHGFYGASSMERLPTEVAVTSQIKKFKQLKFNGNNE